MITETDIKEQCQHKTCCQFPKCQCCFTSKPTAEEIREYRDDEFAAGLDGDHNSIDDNGDDDTD